MKIKIDKVRFLLQRGRGKGEMIFFNVDLWLEFKWLHVDQNVLRISEKFIFQHKFLIFYYYRICRNISNAIFIFLKKNYSHTLPTYFDL